MGLCLSAQAQRIEPTESSKRNVLDAGGQPNGHRLERNSALAELRGMFPALDSRTLLAILDEQQGDVTMAIEKLLELPKEQEEAAKRHACSHMPEDPLEGSMSSACGSADLRQLHNWALSAREDAQYQAARALADLSVNAELQHQIVIEGGIEAARNLLQSDNLETRRCAASTVANLALHDANQAEIASNEELLALLVELVKTNGDPGTREHAARAIANVSYNSDRNERLLMELEGVAALMTCVRCATGPAQCEALAALANLVRNAVIRVEFGRVVEWEPLYGLLRSTQPETKRQTVRLLANLSIGDENKTEIVRSGGLGALVLVAGSEEGEVARLAAMCLANLATLEPNRGAIVAEGAIPPLIGMLQSSEEHQLQAGRALLHLSAWGGQEFKMGLVQEGILPKLISMTHSEEMEVRIMAARMMASLNSIRGISNTW